MTKAAPRDPYVVRLGDALGVIDVRARMFLDDLYRDWERWAPIASAHELALMLGGTGVAEETLLEGLVASRAVERAGSELRLSPRFVADRQADAERRRVEAEKRQQRYERARKTAGEEPDVFEEWAENARNATGEQPEIDRRSTGEQPDISRTLDPIGAGDSADIARTIAGPHAGQETRAHTAPVGAGGVTSTPPTAPPTPYVASDDPPQLPPSLHLTVFIPWLRDVAKHFGWRRGTMSPNLLGLVRIRLETGQSMVEDLYPALEESEGADNRVLLFKHSLERRHFERQRAEIQLPAAAAPSSEEDDHAEE